MVLLAACDRAAPPRYDVGRVASAQEIATLDVDVGPDGAGLPPGRGTVAKGAELFALKCAACHGPGGAGIPPLYPALVGRNPRAAEFGFANDPTLSRTIGDYWPYGTTVFDYVRRAMPFTAPGSLTNDEVYSLTAYLLATNDVIPMNATLDSASLTRVRMPSEKRFVRDNRRGGAEVR